MKLGGFTLKNSRASTGGFLAFDSPFADKCGRCGSTADPRYQNACAKQICTARHVMPDGEVIDCRSDGPVRYCDNFVRCEACGGFEALRSAFVAHLKDRHGIEAGPDFLRGDAL